MPSNSTISGGWTTGTNRVSIYSVDTVQPMAAGSSATLSSRDLQNVYYSNQQFNRTPTQEQIAEAENWRKKQVQAKKKQELESLEQFIATGVPISLTASTNKREMLQVHSRYGFDGEGIMFYIIGKKLMLKKSRTTHLMARFKKLAEREGLDIVYFTEYPKYRFNIRVAYWKFNLAEQDDSELMAQAKLRTSLDDSRINHDGCGDPDCEGCYPDEEEDGEGYDPDNRFMRRLDDLPF